MLCLIIVVEFGLFNKFGQKFHEYWLTENCMLLEEEQNFMFSPPYFLANLGDIPYRK
jgi:hypothetical protein